MACRVYAMIFTAFHVLATLTLLESLPEILFARPLGPGNENDITLTCRSSGGTLIYNAIFRRDGVILNLNEPMPSYQFHITPDGEGGFTCEDGERSEVLRLAAKPKDREVDNKVIYVYRGDVIEIPCDYPPGKAADLYSVEWVRTTVEGGILPLTPTSLPSEPHLSISPANYSLLVNITELEQNGHHYQCTVTVKSFNCESCLSSPIFNESGADITLRVIRRPQISITQNPDMSTDIPEGDEVEYTCDVTAEREIESIYWKVGSSQFTDCSNDTYCVKSTGDNVRVLTVTTAGILTNMEAMTLDIECVVLQKFDDNNIIDPDSHNLTDMTSLTTSSGVSLLMIHPVPPDPSTSEIPTPTITPGFTNTIRPQENSSDKAFLEKEGFLFVIGAVVIIVLIVVGIPALACCIRYKYRDKCKKPSKRTSRPHEYEDVELAHQELPGELFQSMLSRQNGVPYDPNYVELPSWDGNMSDLNQDQVYNSSGASSVFPNFFPNLTSTTSLSSGPYDHTSHQYVERDAGSGSETYAHLHLDPHLLEPPKRIRTKRTSDSSDHSHRSHHRHRSRSPVFNHDTHRHTSQSPVFNHDTHRHTSRSPVFNYDTPRHRSRSPCERCSPSPSHRSAFHVPEPEPVMPLYSKPSCDTPPRPIGHEVLLTVVKCLMHRRDCQIPNCPCKAVQNQNRQLLSDSTRQLNEDSLMECAGCAGIQRQEQMRLSLSTSNLNSNTHPHYHLTSRPQIRHVTPKPGLKRQRSISMDLTPIMEQRKLMMDKTTGTVLFHSPYTSLPNTVDGSPTIPFIDPLEVIQCDSRGRIYHNPSHDIMIKFPERAIPEGETINIMIRVTLTGPFDLPEGTRPVSPIVQLCVQDHPHYRFLKQLEVMLPHYLDITSKEDCRLLQLGFMKAGHDPNSEGKYVFQKMRDIEAVFKPQQKYATLFTDHFCFLCISSCVSSEATARATYCLISALPNSTRCGSRDWTSAYFCVAYFLSTCSKAVEQQFPTGYKLQWREFKFADSSTPLEIVFEEEQCGWILALQSNSKITAEDVDFGGTESDTMMLRHERQTYPPRFEIALIEREASQDAAVRVCVKGAIEDICTHIPLKSNNSGSFSSSASSSSSMSPESQPSHPARTLPLQVLDQRLTLQQKYPHPALFAEPTHPDLMNEIAAKIPHKWSSLGIQLGLSHNEIQVLSVTCHDPHLYFSHVFSIWKSRTIPPYNWKTIIEVLKTPGVNEKRLAKEIQESLTDQSAAHTLV